MALESAGKNTRSWVFFARPMANSCGVWLASDLCGRSVLYSMRHASMMLRAWARLMNQCSFRHSSRNFLWGGESLLKQRAVFERAHDNAVARRNEQALREKRLIHRCVVPAGYRLRVPGDDVEIGLPHVRADELDERTAFLAKPDEERTQALLLAILDHKQ